ncbi:MAG: FAD-dependent thymidylate synthase [Halobacteriota archaeon]|nr:FAD-dependent thymidylate synthase [Halobacteriota archaeon]
MTNKVELIGYYGGDKTHALSAWTSTSRELTAEKEGRIDKLLKMLAREHHYTPFEKSYLHFLLTCDTASHIHLLKHRIAVSINAESARYKELKEDKCYTPYDWPEELQKEFIESTKELYRKYHSSLKLLVEQYGFTRKRAKESARYFLPYGNQLVLDVSFNFKSFMHFQGLRNKEDAQDEIRDIAVRMLDLVRETNQFDLSLEAFGF